MSHELRHHDIMTRIGIEITHLCQTKWVKVNCTNKSTKNGTKSKSHIDIIRRFATVKVVINPCKLGNVISNTYIK